MPLIVAETFLEGCLSVNVISAPDVRRVPAEYKIGVKKTEQISRRIIGSLPSVSFKLRKLHSETAGRTPDIPRKCLIPTAGFLSGWHLDKFPDGARPTKKFQNFVRMYGKQDWPAQNFSCR